MVKTLPKMSAYFLAMRFASSVRMHRSKNSRPICINTNLKLLKILKNGNYIATTGIKEELIGKSISESHIREKSEWYGRGYRTKREKATESGTDLILQKNDILWVVGDKRE
jgi:K+/H+ antiporter YhaU regulatory subunit KhtT